eukprot:gene10636-14283_t
MQRQDQRADALAYLKKHKLLKLFEYLGAVTANKKPSDINEFLLGELSSIADLRASKLPVTLFSETDVENLFSIFDLTNRGYITKAQYMKALQAVGIEKPSLAIPTDDKIDKAQFVTSIYSEIIQDSF